MSERGGRTVAEERTVGARAEAFDALPSGLALVDERFRVAVCNRRFCELLKLPAESVEGAEVDALLPYEPLAARLREASAGGEEKTVEFHRKLPSGAMKACRITLSPRLGEGRLLMVLEDATEQVAREQELVALETSEALRHLARLVSHELRTSLAVLQPTLEHVRDRLREEGAAQLAADLEPIERTLHDLHAFVLTLSGFQHSFGGEPVAADVGELLREVDALIRVEARRRGVRVELVLPDSLPECTLDRRRMKQVFLNLMRNALEAMPHGGVIEVRASVEGTGGTKELAIDVRDTGVGIAEPDVPKAFRPLFSTKPDGMGLGLPYCRDVVERHGGEVRLESREDEGTTVRLTLPVESPEQG